MSREAHVRFCESVGVRFPRATRPYEAMEKRAEEKRARKEAEESAKEREKRLADARALLEAEKQQKTRNGRRFVILDENGESLDYDLVDAM